MTKSINFKPALLAILLIANFSFNSCSQKNDIKSIKLSFGLGAPALDGLLHRLDAQRKPDAITNHSNGIHFKAEYAVREKTGIVISVGFCNSEGSWNDNHHISTPLKGFSSPINRGYYTFESLSVLARVNQSIAKGKFLDLYAGFGIGYRLDSYTSIEFDQFGNKIIVADKEGATFPVSLELGFGLRIFPHENIGIFTEIGLAKSLAQAGIVFRLPGN